MYAGTYLWHGHNGDDRAEGFTGALIVRPRPSTAQPVQLQVLPSSGGCAWALQPQHAALPEWFSCRIARCEMCITCRHGSEPVWPVPVPLQWDDERVLFLDDWWHAGRVSLALSVTLLQCCSLHRPADDGNAVSIQSWGSASSAPAVHPLRKSRFAPIFSCFGTAGGANAMPLSRPFDAARQSNETGGWQWVNNPQVCCAVLCRAVPCCARLRCTCVHCCAATRRCPAASQSCLCCAAVAPHLPSRPMQLAEHQ